MKFPEPENKAQRKVEYKNYHAITMSRNYEEKLLQELSQEIMSQYINHAENVRLQGYWRIQKVNVDFVIDQKI